MSHGKALLRRQATMATVKGPETGRRDLSRNFFLPWHRSRQNTGSDIEARVRDAVPQGTFYPSISKCFEAEAYSAYQGTYGGVTLPQAWEHSQATLRHVDLVRYQEERRSFGVRGHPDRPAQDDQCVGTVPNLGLHRHLGPHLLLDKPERGTVFAKTDLVVVSELCPGPLPKNVVRTSEYREILSIYERLSHDPACKFKMKESARETILLDMAVLLTRPLGREVIRRVLAGARPIEVNYGRGRSQYEVDRNDQGHLQLEEGSLGAFATRQSASGEMSLAPSPRFRALVHELCHHLHELEGTRLADQRRKEGLFHQRYHNREEQYVITGWRRAPHNVASLPDLSDLQSEYRLPGIRAIFEELARRASQNSREGGSDWAAELRAYRPGAMHPDYDPRNEWAICAEFGLLVRQDHQWAGIFPPGSPPNLVSNNGVTPLASAIMGRAFCDAQHLLACGADPRQRFPGGNTALHLAVGVAGSLALVRNLVKRGAEVKAKNEVGSQPLHLAVKQPANTEVVRLLLDRGAGVNDRGQHGLLPINGAVLMAGSTRTVDLLLQRGSRIDVRNVDHDKSTLLHSAAVAAQDPELIRVLLRHGADPQALNAAGETPWEAAKAVQFPQPVNPEVLNALPRPVPAPSPPAPEPLASGGLLATMQRCGGRLASPLRTRELPLPTGPDPRAGLHDAMERHRQLLDDLQRRNPAQEAPRTPAPGAPSLQRLNSARW